MLRRTAETRPILFVIGLAILQPLIALPLVVLFKGLGWPEVGLRLVIPAVQSVFVVWVILHLGWRVKAGLGGRVENVHLLWFPALAAFVPVLIYGTIGLAFFWVAFYFAALIATGVSEEGFARGIALPALLRYGKWGAVLIAAAIFSAGHVTNAFFEEFTLLEWIDKFWATFAFGILYGALFLRTGNLWPLIFLHAVHDYSYLTSGSLGPFIRVQIDTGLHMALSTVYLAYGLLVLWRGELAAVFAASAAGERGEEVGRSRA